MNEDFPQRKISTPRRKGDSYELRLLALSCLRMLSELTIEHVRHEDSSAAPADDVIIESSERIECFQAKHAMGQHALLDFDPDVGELVDQSADLHISLAELGKAWKSLRHSGKEIIIRIFTNRAAGANLGSFLDGDRFRDGFVRGTWQKIKRKKLQKILNLSDGELVIFLGGLRFDLRQPNEEVLDEIIQRDWLQRRLGLNAPGVYGRFMASVERWYLEKKSRPIYRENVLEALQIDNSTLPQRFPIDLKTYVARPAFEKDVLQTIFRDGATYTAIVGPPGSGKSTFITQLIKKLRRQGQPLVRYYAFTQINDPLQRERVGVEAFLKSMIEQLRQEFPEIIPDERRYEYTESRLNELLILIGNHFNLRGQQLLMVVDGLDHVGRAEIEATQKLLRVLPLQLPHGVVCLIGSQSTEYLPAAIERQCRGEAKRDIPLFELTQTHRFLMRYFEAAHLPNYATIREIHKRSEGLPLYLRFIAEQLAEVSIEEYDNLVAKLPPHGGHINSYYGALWDEFSNETDVQKLCGLAARLRFRVQVADILAMADIKDAFEGKRLFGRMKHLMQVSETGCRVFHNSFRDFIRSELLPEQLQQLDAYVLSYLNARRNQLLWFMYAHRYAESADDRNYLIANYGQSYISEAIRRGRPAHEIVGAIQSVARAAVGERNLVATARSAALLSHTQDRLETYLDRTQLWRTLLAVGEIDDALAAFAQEREVYDLSAETARIIVHLAERGEYELGRVLAQDFLESLPGRIEGGDYTIAIGELISVYSSRAATILSKWIGKPPEPNDGGLFGRIDVGSKLLPIVLRNIYLFGRWQTLRTLKRLLLTQPGWVARKDAWLLQIVKLETKHRPNTAAYHARDVARRIKKQNERILLAGHVARNDLGTDIVEMLLKGIVLHPQLEYKDGWAPKSTEFEIFRAYVAALGYIRRYNELQVLNNYLQISNSSVAAYYRISYEISTSNNQPENLLAAIAHLTEHERRLGERMVEIQVAVTGDLPSLIKDIVNRYITGEGEVDLLLENFSFACEGKTFSIPRITGLQVLATFPVLRGRLQNLLVEVHDYVFKTELETQSRTNELLLIAELAGMCGHFQLGRDWLQEAVQALRGYGYRKDPTVSLLIQALEEIHSLEPEPFRKRVADIAEWNLLIWEFTDGKTTRWFPRQLFSTTVRLDLVAARGLLATYRHNVVEWQFSDVLQYFLSSYNGEELILAYILSELILEYGTGYEENCKEKFEVRLHLLKVAVANASQDIKRWLERRIRQFLLTEIPPTERGFCVDWYNKYAAEAGLAPITSFSTYPAEPSNTKSSPGLQPPSQVEFSGRHVSRDTLIKQLSDSVENFKNGIEQLLEQHNFYEIGTFVKEAAAQLINRTTIIFQLNQIVEALQTHRESLRDIHEIYSYLAAAYLKLGRPDKAAEQYEKAFMDANRFNLWELRMEEFQKLADINPEKALNVLFKFLDRHLKDYSWGGETTFLLFIKGIIALGDNYRQRAVQLYEAFHTFVESQFEHLPSVSPSPYAWLRKSDYQIDSFENIAHDLIIHAWTEPVLHCRQHLVHFLKDFALCKPNSIIPWLVSLLQHEDFTVNTQSALILASVTLENSNLLSNYIDALLEALDTPHAERTYYLTQALQAILNNIEDKDKIRVKLESLRPSLVSTGLVLLPSNLSPSSYFRNTTLKNTARSIRKIIEKICEGLDFDLNEIYWRIEQEMEAIGFNRDEANQEFGSRWQNYSSNTNQDYIPFETYDDYYVWHAFNRVLERLLRETPIDSSAQYAIDALVRLYDTRFPHKELHPKPNDITVPFVHKGYGSDELTNEVQDWLNFEGEEVLKEQNLENLWIPVVDEYYQKAGRIVEKRLATSFLATPTLADAILRGDCQVQSGEALLQLAPEPPYYSLMIDEAQHLLQRSRTDIEQKDSLATIPLVSLHWGWWWHYIRSTLASITGEWIQRYNLSWDDANGLGLLFNNNLAQKLLFWCDGFEVGFSHRSLVGYGTRLLLSKELLQTLMKDYKLNLVVVSWSNRILYTNSSGKEHEIEYSQEKEVVVVYRCNN
ncbi:NACHT domain-containing protein [Rivularia sp. UHCC 0363]|uniref:NACHT domain-containing protein n=1 Tax=Rivularia sp. UHCC 0363 TaxID=3110244 RepID=UPI002B1FED2B|nr:NACHT domain-containing protein [Rivularia sp. UHCC 0363]MEA5598718.1 NACHT domain-containing protein [Rivularia sp. UHCC 0363]